MGHGARVGRVALLAVPGRGVGEAQRVEWDVVRSRRAGGGGRMAEAVRGAAWGKASVVELVGQRRVEHEVRYGLGLGGIEGRSLVEEEVSLRRTASG